MSGFSLEEERQLHRKPGPVPDRPKKEHILHSQGPFSSLKAVIKRRKSNSQSKLSRGHCRRRPEITIVSSEPLGRGKVSPDCPQELSAPRAAPPQCTGSVCEETQGECVVRPVAPPRRLNCTSSNSTPHSTAPTAAPGKTPPKPPRPSAPKNKKSVSVDRTNVDLTSKPECADHKPESTLSIRSVTVYWNNTTTAATTASSCIQPVPLPRIKSKRPLVLLEESQESQTLVQLCENTDLSNCIADTLSSNKYLEELREVFSSENILNQCIADTENADEMSLRDRIQAFENQYEDASEPVKPQPKTRAKPPVSAKPPVTTKPQYNTDDLYEEVSYSPPTPAPKPAKPPERAVSHSVKEELNSLLAQHRSKPPKLTRERTIDDEEEIVTVAPKEPLRPNLNINNHNNYASQPMYENAEREAAPEGFYDPLENEYDTPDSTYEDHTTQDPEITQSEYEFVEYTSSPSTPEEPDYDSVDSLNEDKTTNEHDHVPVKPEPSKSNYASSRQSLTKRPTTIIVPSKSTSFSDSLQDNPPPLPVQKPVGKLTAPQPTNRHSVASFPPQISPIAAPEPTLPPRRLTTKKSLPPRPASVRSGPGRPPPPRADIPPKAQITPPRPQSTEPKSQSPKPTKKGPVLPPRPSPGHQLYNKYTLQIPHAIASRDYKSNSTGELSFQKNEVLVLVNSLDPNTFECQVGDRRGKVHRSSLKVITPLSSQHTPAQPGKAAASGGGLRVEALHDFSPENPGELGLNAGDVVTLVEQVDSEWYKGTCKGSSGFFPINYVKVLTDSPTLPNRTGIKPSAAVSGPRCVARFDFEGEHSDELSFSEGDVIQLKAYVGQDWARGQLGTSSGIFPLNFVEIVQDLPPAPTQTQPSKIALPGMSKGVPPRVTPPAQSESEEWVVALYDFSGNSDGDLSFEKGDRITVTKHINAEWSRGRLQGREGMFPRAFVESKTGEKAVSRSSQSGAGGVKAKALYDFTSTSEEELFLKVGDVITNVESVDDQWFLGDLRGKRALVPKNYVQVL